jgi:hypothetical protein
MHFHCPVYELTIRLGPEPRPEDLPSFLTAPELAALHSQYWGRITAREIRRDWPLIWQRVGDKEKADVATFVAEAQRRFEARTVPPLPLLQQVFGSRSPAAPCRRGRRMSSIVRKNTAGPDGMPSAAAAGRCHPYQSLRHTEMRGK